MDSVSKSASSSSSSGSTDDLIMTALPAFVFCHLVAPTSLKMDLNLLTTWDGMMDMLWLYRVGCAASIAGSGTDGLDVVGHWVSGRSFTKTTGRAGGPVSGTGLGGRGSMTGWVS